MPKPQDMSVARQARAKRKLTTPNVKDGRCIDQSIVESEERWKHTGEPKQYVRYLHVTKGWRTRLLMPIYRLVRR